MAKEHPPWPKGHLFGAWMPKDRKHSYRVCIHPDCRKVEVREEKN